MKNKTKKLTFLALTTAFALILSYVESLFPPILSALPGIKIGIPNIALLVVLFSCGFRYAICVSVLRTIFAALFFGNPMIFLYSISGALFSLLVMSVLMRTSDFGKTGISIAGGVSHNLAQTAVATITLKTNMLFYLPALLISGVIAGTIVGIAGALALRTLTPIIPDFSRKEK